jgi:hypothetical protein
MVDGGVWRSLSDAEILRDLGDCARIALLAIFLKAQYPTPRSERPWNILAHP